MEQATAGKRTPFWLFSRQKKEHDLYKKWGPRAEKAKIFLQFIVGLCLVALLVAKVIALVAIAAGRLHDGPFAELAQMKTLELVAFALEYSAGLELAYTLFTEGPDEAVEPVIMAFAAAMLLGISKIDSIDILVGCGAVVFVLALAGLFLVRHYFVVPQEDSPESANSAVQATPNPLRQHGHT